MSGAESITADPSAPQPRYAGRSRSRGPSLASKEQMLNQVAADLQIFGAVMSGPRSRARPRE